MIELKFYRDDEYVYYNNPNGITKKMTIADFEALMSGSDGSDSDAGCGIFVVNYNNETDSIDKSYKEIKEAVASGKVVMLTRIAADNESAFIETALYLTDITHQNTDSYVVTFGSSFYNDLSQKADLSVFVFEATTDTGTMEKIYPVSH